jgi:hypothetical protein
VATWNPSTPWPVSCPGAWSLTNKYSGIPPYVTCVPPSGREIVPSLLALTPLPAVAELTPAGRSTGGHVVAHESVHMIVPPLSDANAYSVDPLESTSTVPTPGIDFVPIMTDPACVVVELPPPELGAAFLAQADKAISAAAEAIQTWRAVLVDDFTFDLLRAGGSRARPTLLLAYSRLGIRSGPRSGSFGSTAGIDPRSNPFALPSVVPRHAVPPSSRREEVDFEHAELAHDLQED